MSRGVGIPFRLVNNVCVDQSEFLNFPSSKRNSGHNLRRNRELLRYEFHASLVHFSSPSRLPPVPIVYTFVHLSITHPSFSQSHTPPSLNRTPLPLSIARPSLSQSHAPPSLNRTPLPLSIAHPSLSESHTPPSLNHSPLPLSIAHPSLSESHTPPSLNHSPLPLSIAHPSLSQSLTPPSQSLTPPSLNHTPLPLSITLPSHQMRRRTALPSELAAGRERPRSEPPIPRENLVVEGKWSIGTYRMRLANLTALTPPGVFSVPPPPPPPLKETQEVCKILTPLGDFTLSEQIYTITTCHMTV